MTRGTRREARTQDAPICKQIGASEDAASRRVTPVRRPGLLSGQALNALCANDNAYGDGSKSWAVRPIDLREDSSRIAGGRFAEGSDRQFLGPGGPKPSRRQP